VPAGFPRSADPVVYTGPVASAESAGPIGRVSVPQSQNLSPAAMPRTECTRYCEGLAPHAYALEPGGVLEANRLTHARLLTFSRLIAVFAIFMSLVRV
jgi:hypothetical protein